MTVTINGTTGITTPGVTNSGNETVSGTLAVTGAVTGSGLSTTLYPLVSGTAVASTSGTSIDFTGIPSWVKRITVMLSGVSLSGTANLFFRLGTGGVAATTGYNSLGQYATTGTNGSVNTTAFNFFGDGAAAYTRYGQIQFCHVGSNNWTAMGIFCIGATVQTNFISGAVALGGVLDMVRVTSSNGTDTFDAGLINILYE